MNSIVVLIIVLLSFAIIAYTGASLHEREMINSCINNGTFETWNKTYTFTCAISFEAKEK